MTKIIRIDFPRLRNEEHFQFGTDMITLFNQNFIQRSVEAATLYSKYDEYTQLLEKEDMLIERIKKNMLTDPIGDADRLRDNTASGVSHIANAYAFNANPEKVEAARKIKIIIKHYGNLREKSYNEETASIYNFIQDVRNTCADEMELIGLTPWIEEFEEQNRAFEELMNQRFNEQANQDDSDLRELRKQVDKVFAELRDFIEAINLMSGGVTYTDLINQMNQRIEYYKNTLATRKGRADAKKDKEEGENDPGDDDGTEDVEF